MKKKKSLYAVLVGLLLISACTKFITTEIGVGELIPPIDGITVKDTMLEVYINTYDTVSTVSSIENVHVLGTYSDAPFGKVESDVYVQMQPSYYPFRFAVSKDSITQIDSVVLIMQTIGRAFGDKATNAGFRIYEVNDASFSRTKGYPYRNFKTFSATSEISYNGMEQFASAQSIKDSIKAYGDTIGTANQMRLRLNNSFAQKLVNIDTSKYRNDSLFLQAFQGFKIASTSGNTLIPVMPYGSRLAIYYKYTSRKDGSADTAVNYFSANPFTSASANHIENNYTGTALASLPLGDTATGSEFVYLQSAPGVYARARVPGLGGLPNMLIYRAELIMDEEPKSTGAIDSTFAPNLFVSGFENNKRILLRDAQFLQKSSSNGFGLNAFYTSNLQQFGSFPNLKKDTANGLYYRQYNFQLTQHVQDIVKKVTPNYELDVFAPFADSLFYPPLNRYVNVQDAGSGGSYYNLNYPSVHRAKIFGNKTNSLHKIRLHIVYSPVP